MDSAIQTEEARQKQSAVNYSTGRSLALTYPYQSLACIVVPAMQELPLDRVLRLLHDLSSFSRIVLRSCSTKDDDAQNLDYRETD